MQDNSHKTLLGAILIIGIIIVVILLSRSNTTVGYSYRGTQYAASALPLNVNVGPATGTYSIVRYVPRTAQTYSSGSTYTYYTYPQTQYVDYSYQQYDNGTVFPDGCTLTSPVSTTTGLPCS
jgi:hypothetical protein